MDGNRVKQIYTSWDGQGNPSIAVTAYFMGGAYEVTGTNVKKYYAIAGMTVAMKDDSGLKFLLTDHLGSVVAVTDSSGVLIGQQRYLPFGQVRSDLNPPHLVQTDFGYTGQRDNSYINLVDYKSRWYSADLGRFLSPDSIVPNPANPQSLNRFSYVLNNPVRYNDPTGHRNCEEDGYNCSPENEGEKVMFNIYRPDYVGLNAAEGIISKSDRSYLNTYTAASIGVQNPYITRTGIIGTIANLMGHASGLANATDAQMETPRDEAVGGNPDVGGYGLGLRAKGTCCQPDQANDSIAVAAMRIRIQSVTTICENHGCTATDVLIAAALAENGPGFTQDNMRILVGPKATRTSGSATINWKDFLMGPNPAYNSYNRKLILKFAVDVRELQDRGWYVPPVDWSYLYNLETSTAQP